MFSSLSVDMEHWRGRVALVTGASAGIGASIISELVRHGMQVIGFARREEKVKELAEQLKTEPGKLFSYKGDVSKEEDVKSAFAWAKEKFGGVDVLINNAGVLNQTSLHDGELEAWRQMLDVNVLGLSLCSREAVRNMKQRGVDDGYIINLSSLVAHSITNREGFLMYCATKHAVKVLGEGIRRELVAMGSNIRVTSISPGVVETELFDSLQGDGKEKTLREVHLLPEDIASAVVYILSTPQRVQIQDIIMKPTGCTY